MTKPNLIAATIYLFLSCSIFSISYAQLPVQLKGDKIVSTKDQLIKDKWAAFKKNKQAGYQEEDLYTLPVVFHIIHQNGSENIADAIVMDAFQRLNDAFANRGFYDQGSGVDTKIQFCMAKKDPDGNYTTGINRVYADIPRINWANSLLLQSLIKWDPDKYINIYVVTEVDILIQFNKCEYRDQYISGFGGGGIVVAQANSLQSIIVHEMGHALGLAHTFDGWCPNNDCLVNGDGICDTPPEETITIKGTCTDPENSCHTDTQSGFTSDQNDLKTNHMDYGNQGCQHDFTQGQKERMRWEIETFHPGWLTTDVCTNDCASPAESEFSFFSFPEYSIGRTISFTNTSTGAIDYEWSVNNSFVSSSVNYSYVFPGQGWYQFSLLAKPAPDDMKCRNRQVNFVRVYCSVKSTILRDKKKAKIGETIHFSSNITDVVPMPEPIQYEWYANNVLFGTGSPLDHAFTTEGLKIIYLVTVRGGCRDTSLADEIIIKGLPDYVLDLEGLVCTGAKTNKVRFSVCNKEDFETPAGLPITFYNADPRLGRATRIGTTFYTNEVIGAYCCKEFEFELPGNYTGTGLFGVVNDNYSHPPPYNLATDFPVTLFLEKIYINNLDSLSLDKFSVVIAPGDVSVPITTSVSLTAIPSEPASVTWIADHGNFSCDTCINTFFTPVRYTRVIVKAISEGGCLATDTIIVKVLANGEVFIPSAFTPNNDKLNDYFYVLGGVSVSKISSLMVYNRWGEKVFSKQNGLPNTPLDGWDGKLKGYPAVPDVYVYLITVEFVNGAIKKYKGTITLIR